MAGIRVELELQDGSFTSRILHAGESIQQFNRNVAKSDPELRKMADSGQLVFRSMTRVHETSRGLLQTFRDVSIAFGAVSLAMSKISGVANGVVGQIVLVNAEFERLRFLMASMSTAADPMADAARSVDYLKSVAREAPFSIKALTDTFVRLKSTGIDPLDGSFQSLVDAVASFGGNDSTLERAALAISQMSGKGVIQLEELRQQLGEAVPRATELMARALGVTYSDLVSKIATGRVKAEPALKALSAELERTFGGQASRMMTTFSGQMSLLQTNFRELSLGVGEAGFFAEVKNQLREVNAFLESDTARQWARRLGEGLTEGIRFIRQAIATVIEFKNEIVQTGIVIGSAFAVSRGIQGIQAMINAFREMRTAIIASTVTTPIGAFAQSVSTTFANLRAEMAGYQVAAAATAASTTTMTRSMTFFTNAAKVSASVFGFLRVAMVGLVTTLTAIAPYLTLLATGVMLVADYFGFFTNKARDAAEGLDTFGNATREQIELSRQFVAQKEEELRVLEEQRERVVRNSGIMALSGLKALFGDKTKEEYRAEAERAAGDEYDIANNMAERRRQIAETEKKIADAERAAEQRAIEDAARSRQTAAEEELVRVQREYDEKAKAQVKAYEEERASLIAQKKGIEDAEARHQATMKRLQLANYEDRLAILLRQDEILMRQQERGNALEIEAAQRVRDNLAQQIATVSAQLEAARAMNMGIELTDKAPDTEKFIQRAQQHLDRLRGEVEDYRADLAGANGETARLIYQLQQGKYGDPTNGAIKDLIEDLILAQDEVENLSNVLEGKSKLENDINRALINTNEEIFELQNKNATEAQKIVERVRAGYYGPLTESPMARQMSLVRDRFNETSVTANRAAESMRNALGPQIQGMGNTMLDTILKIRDAWLGVNSAVNASPMERLLMAAGRVGAGIGGAIGGVGARLLPGNSFLERLIGQESGGDPNAQARTSSAVGLGQFISGTWLEFLRETRGLVANSKGEREELLAMRTNPEMMKEAIGWYAGKNANFLQANGQDYNDANLYLAHFLGPDGALKALTSGMGSMVRDVLPKQTASNQFMADWSIGDLIGWAEKKFGTGYSAVGGGSTMMGGVAQGFTPQMPVDLMPRYQELVDAEEKLRTAISDKALSDEVNEINAAIKAAGESSDDFGKRLRAVRQAIAEGKFGEDTNPDAERYREIIEAAKQLDATEQKIADDRKLRSQADSQLADVERRKQELAEKAADATRKLTDPSAITRGDGYFQLEKQLEKYIETAKRLYGEDSAAYRQALADKSTMLQQYQDNELLEKSIALEQQTQRVRESMMTEADARRSAYQTQMAEYQALLDQIRNSTTMSNEARVQAEAQVLEAMAALQQQYAASGPMGKQMMEWSKLGENFEKATVGWMNSAADAIANFVTTGEFDLKKFTDSIIKDMTRLAVQWAMSGIGGMGKGGGGGKGKAGGAMNLGAMAGGGGKGKIFGILRHSGGMVDTSGFGRSVSALAFAGAPRFHTGGIIGRDEVPIIARKGEGVFTPEQMAAVGAGLAAGGGGGGMMVTNNIKVDGASAVTPEGRDDLAKRVAKEVEASVRKMVTKEITQQKRQGGALAGR